MRSHSTNTTNTTTASNKNKKSRIKPFGGVHSKYLVGEEKPPSYPRNQSNRTNQGWRVGSRNQEVAFSDFITSQILGVFCVELIFLWPEDSKLHGADLKNSPITLRGRIVIT